MSQLHCVHEGTRVHVVYSRRAQAAVESCWMASTPAAHSAVASLLVGTTATSRLTFRVLGHLILVCAFSFSGRSFSFSGLSIYLLPSLCGFFYVSLSGLSGEDQGKCSRAATE